MDSYFTNNSSKIFIYILIIITHYPFYVPSSFCLVQTDRALRLWIGMEVATAGSLLEEEEAEEASGGEGVAETWVKGK